MLWFVQRVIMLAMETVNNKLHMAAYEGKIDAVVAAVDDMGAFSGLVRACAASALTQRVLARQGA